MAQNDRLANFWSRPRRPAPAKGRFGCPKEFDLEESNLDDLGDIVNLLSDSETNRHGRDAWKIKNSKNVNYASTDCCLKNGRVQCSCMWPKNNYAEKQTKNQVPKFTSNWGSRIPYGTNSSKWDNDHCGTKECFSDSKMLEEFIFDDNDLALLNYDIPIDMPKRHHMRNIGKVKTVSIIDTLSELASGATDREDEGGFSSAVSESAILNRNLYKPKNRHVRQSLPRKDKSLRSNYLTSLHLTSKIPPPEANHFKNTSLNNSSKVLNDSFNGAFNLKHINQDDSNFTCSSLKRTLKYLRKAVSSNVVQEETNARKHIPSYDKDQDSMRLCFSDSEIKDTSDHWKMPVKRDKAGFKSKPKNFMGMTDSFLQHPSLPSSVFHGRTKATVPDWIQEVFTAAKKGNVDKIKQNLKDIDPALIRNLSDDHGNNLWHICAAHNNFECLNWLCSHNPHHQEALKDENKNGFSPITLAIKHGSLLAVQWLIYNTICKAQLVPKNDSRSLLHVAARYGQDAIVDWLLGYMNSQNLNVSIIDSEGNTALHLASKYGHIACVKTLIFQCGNLKTRNEQGLKPLDLAVKYSKTDCADYLIAIESCYNLANIHLRQQCEIQQLQKENAEMKNYFKELLTLTKQLHHQQQEFVQSFSKVNLPAQYNLGSNERTNEKNNMHLDEYSHLLSSIITDEEHRLLMLEERWKKSRKQMKFSDTKRKPLDILKSQFAHVLEKVVNRSPPMPSTPETSDDSWQSGDEDLSPNQKNFADFSAPDVVNSLSPQSSIPYLNSRRKYQKETSSSNIVNNNIKGNESLDSSFSFTENSRQSSGSLRISPKNSKDVNLRMFFKQNPSLRQTSETCSVLEVLEPSSSDSEDCLSHKKKVSQSYNSEKEAEHSSSSSAIETYNPYSCRPSSSGSKASGSRSSSNGSRQNPFPKNSSTSQNDSNSVSEKSKTTENSENISTESVGDKGASDQLLNNNSDDFSVEPDLIKGTQKKKIPSHFSSADIEKKSKEIAYNETNTSECHNITDNEHLEADKSLSHVTETHDNSITSLDSSVTNTFKKKNFLLKFALRGRWPSKAITRSSKNEISPEEFRETYSRSTLLENGTPSQLTTISDSPRKHNPCPKNEIENNLNDNHGKDVLNNIERSKECNPYALSSTNDRTNQGSIPARRGLLPPRRDPPPAPPLNIDEHSQDVSDDESSIRDKKSSVSSCIDDCMSHSVSLHNSYLMSQSSDMWHSPNSKPPFRPASSASRIDSPSRAEENFPLNKSSSASTEMLSALDSSTAGRQSPAPSEVSKTESALSPPSDVSKTESTRYLSQLGRIDESAHLASMKSCALQNKEEQNVKEISLVNEVQADVKQKKKSKKEDSDKPWYEFSDEEDVIVPQRYKAISGSMRSSSEDEETITT